MKPALQISIPTLWSSALLLFSSEAEASSQLFSPAPFNGTNNPHRTTPPDEYLDIPFNPWDVHEKGMYPCRGYLSLLNTPQGAPTAMWAAGSNQTWSLQGNNSDDGGSCYIGFLDGSESGDDDDDDDGLKLFKLVESYEGDCPHRNALAGPHGQQFEFTVPEDLPIGVRVFAWIANNTEHEFNMNCAAVNITKPDTDTGKSTSGVNPQPDQTASAAAYSLASTSSGSSDRTSPTLTTVWRTSTIHTTTTITPSSETSESVSSGNSGLAAAQIMNTITPPQADSMSIPSVTPSFSPSMSSGTISSSEEVTTVFSVSTATVTTTVSDSYGTPVSSSGGDGISTTISGLSALLSLLLTSTSPAAAPDLSPSASYSSIATPPSTSANVTTVLSTTTIEPSGSTSAGFTNPSVSTSQPVASTTATSGSMSILSSSLDASTSYFSPSGSYPTLSTSQTSTFTNGLLSLFPSSLSDSMPSLSVSAPPSFSATQSTSLPGVMYTSTTTTIWSIVTDYPSSASASASASVTASFSSLGPLSGSNGTAAADSSHRTTHFSTANGCSCACPAGKPANIADCNCFCPLPKDWQSKLNSTSNFKLDVAAVKTSNKDDVARPDDHVTHVRRSRRTKHRYLTTTTSTALRVSYTSTLSPTS